MRLVKTRDAKVIAMLNEPVQNLHHKLYPNIFKPYEFKSICEYFSNIITHEKHHFIICKDNELPIGYIWFEEVQLSATAFSIEKHYLYIHQVSVNEEYRGKGAGKLLFDSVITFAKEIKVERIGLDYWMKNETAKAIYEKMGFQLEREVVFLDL